MLVLFCLLPEKPETLAKFGLYVKVVFNMNYKTCKNVYVSNPKYCRTLFYDCLSKYYALLQINLSLITAVTALGYSFWLIVRSLE